MSGTGTWQSLFAELRRRKVFRVATIYVITLWPLIQLADILQPALQFSDAVISTLLYGFIAGFPLALALAWLYDLTREGVVRTADTPPGEPPPPKPLINRTVEAIMIGALMVLVLALFLVKMTLAPPRQQAAPAATPVTPAGIESIAVLPFSSFSARDEDQVFADGLTEELLNVLSRMQRLRVAARTSSFAYKGVNRNVQEVGRELGVNRILEGSVRRNDVSDTIRVTAQLVDVESGAHVWSQTYDREYRDVFRIQDEIASAVADQLSVTLLHTADAPQGVPANATPQAFLVVSRGRAALAKRSPSAISSAIELFEEGVAASPDWAEAHALLATAYVLEVLYTGADRESHLAKAQQAADLALALDPRLGSAWASQGLIHMQYEDRKETAKDALLKAIELNPSYAMAYMWLGSLQETVAERLRYHRKALELDPRSAVAAFNVASDLLDGGDEDEAMKVFEQIVTADPFYPGTYRLTASINALHGRLDDAIDDNRRAYDLDSDPIIALQIAQLLLALDDLPQARQWLERASEGLAPHMQTARTWVLALIDFQSGDPARARERITRMAMNPPPGMKGELNSTLAYGVIEQYALAAQRFDKAMQLAPGHDAPPPSDDALDPYLAAVRSYRAVGRGADADRVLQQVKAYVDARLSSSGRADPQLWYQRALITLYEGDRTAALQQLQRAIDEGWSEAWRLQVDPSFAPLRENEQFKLIERTIAARMQIMRDALKEREP